MCGPLRGPGSKPTGEERSKLVVCSENLHFLKPSESSKDILDSKNILLQGVQSLLVVWSRRLMCGDGGGRGVGGGGDVVMKEVMVVVVVMKTNFPRIRINKRHDAQTTFHKLDLL